MLDRGHRRRRRLTMATLVGLLIAGLVLPASSGIATAAEPRSGRDAAVRTFHEAPSFGTTAVTDGTVGVKSSLGYVYGDNSTAIVGEILNLRPTRTRRVQVTVNYFDAAENSLGFASTNVYLDQINRGGVAPFVIFDPDGPCDLPPDDTTTECVASYLIEASTGSGTTRVVGGPLDIEIGPEVVVDGFRYYEGTITNPNSFAVVDTRAMITVYAANGNVLEVFADDFGDDPRDPTPLLPGESRPYSFGIDTDIDDTTASTSILADGFAAGDPTNYITSWANVFDDLPLVTFRGDIVWLAEHRITGGCGDGKYCPSSNVTRAQMAQFLDRVLDLPSTTRNFFSDDNGITGEASIDRLAASKITGGCGGTRFCPKAFVKRDQMASFLARGLKLSGSAPNAFTDDNGNTHEGSINRIARESITGGCGNDKYCPSANVTRGQMAAFLRRAFEE